MSEPEDRPRRRSVRPPLSDPELEQRVAELEAERAEAQAALEKVVERVEKVAERIERAPTDGIVVAPVDDEDSLAVHVEAIRDAASERR